MDAQRTENGRANALKRELEVRVEERCWASPEVVYDLLADLPSHLVWGGERQKKRKPRLISIEAPKSPATVGAEFSTLGTDVMGGFTDHSVVTESSRPGLFEFVTEATLTTKKGREAHWTNVHHYEITPDGDGSRIAYTVRIVRISSLPGMLAIFNVSGLSALALRAAAAGERRGVRNLARMAQERG